MSIGDLSINLNLDDRDFNLSLRRADRLIDSFRGSVRRTDRQLRDHQGSLNRWGQNLRNISMTLGALPFAFQALGGAISGTLGSIVRANAQMERMNQLMVGLSTSAGPMAEVYKDAAKQMEYLFNLADSTPFDLTALQDGMIKFKTAGLDPTDGSFQALIDSVARFGGSSQHLHRASIAIQQMAGKGVISMEELRQQLGEAVPTAMRSMARGMGVSMGELTEVVSTGTLEAKNALEAMFVQMTLESSGSALKMSRTWNGLMSRLSTKWLQFKAMIGDQGAFDLAKTALEDLVMAMDGLAFQRFGADIGEALATAIIAIKDITVFLVENIGVIKVLATGWIAYAVATSGAVRGTVAGLGRISAAHGVATLSSAELTRNLNITNRALLAQTARTTGLSSVAQRYSAVTARQAIAQAALQARMSGLAPATSVVALSTAQLTRNLTAANRAVALQAAGMNGLTLAAQRYTVVGAARATAAAALQAGTMTTLAFATTTASAALRAFAVSVNAAIGPIGWLMLGLWALYEALTFTSEQTKLYNEMLKGTTLAADEETLAIRRSTVALKERELALKKSQRAEIAGRQGNGPGNQNDSKYLDAHDKEVAQMEANLEKIRENLKNSTENVASITSREQTKKFKQDVVYLVDNAKLVYENALEKVGDITGEDRTKALKDIKSAYLEDLDAIYSPKLAEATARRETLIKERKAIKDLDKNADLSSGKLAELETSKAMKISIENELKSLTRLSQDFELVLLKGQEDALTKGQKYFARIEKNVKKRSITLQAEMDGVSAKLRLFDADDAAGKMKDVDPERKKRTRQMIVDNYELIKAKKAQLELTRSAASQMTETERKVHATARAFAKADAKAKGLNSTMAVFQYDRDNTDKYKDSKSGELDAIEKSIAATWELEKATKASAEATRNASAEEKARSRRLGQITKALLKQTGRINADLQLLGTDQSNPWLKQSTGMNSLNTAMEQAKSQLQELGLSAAEYAKQLSLINNVGKAAFKSQGMLDTANSVKDMESKTQGLTRALMTQKDQIRETHAETNAWLDDWYSKATEKGPLTESQIASFKEYKKALDSDLIRKTESASATLLRTWSDTSDEMDNVWKSAMEGMSDALVGFIKTGKFDMGNFLVEIGSMILKAQINKQIADAFGGSKGGLMDVLGDFASSLFSGGSGLAGKAGATGGSTAFVREFADGGIMTQYGSAPLRKYANGGIAHSPQIALYGEGSGAEAFVPLPDGRSIPVTMEGGGQAQAPNVVVNVVNKSGQQMGAKKQSQSFDGKTMILDVVLDAVSKPGNYRNSMKSALS